MGPSPSKSRNNSMEFDSMNRRNYGDSTDGDYEERDYIVFDDNNNNRQKTTSANAAQIASPSSDKSLRFHEVCGKNIYFTEAEKTCVERCENTYCDGIVFTHRPLKIYEKVYVKVKKLSTLWIGTLRIGFTSVDPQTLKRNQQSDESMMAEEEGEEYDPKYRYKLPKYAYPTLTNKNGYWAASVGDVLKENDVLYFYLNLDGEIHYGVNNTPKGVLSERVEIYNEANVLRQLWAIFDVYGNTLSIELVNMDALLVASRSEYLSRQAAASILAEDEGRNRSGADASLNGRSLNSVGSSMSSHSSSSSSSVNSSTYQGRYFPWANSAVTTMIPASSVAQRPDNSQQREQQRLNRRSFSNQVDDVQLDRMFISCRRLCVDNHLNQTLHNSILNSGSASRAPRQNSTLGEQSIVTVTSSNCSETFPIGSSRLLGELYDKIRRFYESIPILLHETNAHPAANRFLKKVHGKNVNIFSPDCLIAYRESSIAQLKDRLSSTFNIQKTCKDKPTQNAYVFLEKPIEKGKNFCIQIVGIDQGANEASMSLGIGCTTCNPSQLIARIDLPDDSDELLDRPEYWVVFKNFITQNSIARKHQVALADELCFRLDETTGNLHFYINRTLVTNCLFNVDATQKLWFFFDLCGKINAIRLIPQCHPDPSNVDNSTSSVNVNTNSATPRKRRPNSALIDYFRSQLIPDVDEQAEDQNQIAIPKQAPSNTTPSTNNNNQEECRICWDAPIECVFYSCGHMCLCWNCANTLKKPKRDKQGQVQEKSSSSKKPICPICREEIIDIIRFFKT